MKQETKFDMRDTLKDQITGFTGVVVAISFYDTGCTHYGLAAPMDKDGKVPDWEWFDETRLELAAVEERNIAAARLSHDPIRRGGPAAKPPQW